jgi:autotransporter-associated beta strand protein
MATWDGFFSTNFLAPINWTGGLPNQNSLAIIDSSTMSGANLDPVLLANNAITIAELEQSARIFSVEGTLTVLNSVTLSGTGTLNIQSTGTVLPGGFGLTMTGGTLNNFGTLDGALQVQGGLASNAGTVTGAVTVSGGTLNLNAGSDLSDSATLTVNTGGIVNMNVSENVGLLAGTGGEIGIGLTHILTVGTVDNSSFAGVISGDGSLTKDGSGTLTLTGDNTYTGGTTISEGTVQVGAGGATGRLGTGDVVNNGALVFDRSGSNFVDNAISGTGTLTATEGDILVLSGTNTYSGTTTINAGGSLQVGSGGTSGTLGTGAVTNNGFLTFARSDNPTVANVISGSGGVGKDGGGTLILSGASTYSGDTTISEGTLDITGSIASLSVNVNNSASLRVDGSAISDTATVTLNGFGNLTLTGNERIGALASASGTTTVTLGTFTLTTGDAGNDTFAGVISDTGGLTKLGAGTFTLAGANTYSGTTTVSGGVLSVTGAIASSNITVTAGSLRVDGSAIADTATVTLSGTGNLNLTGNERIGALASASGTTTVTLGTFTLTTGDEGNDSFAGVIGGTGGLTKQGTGTLTLSGANSYTGTTTVSAGTLTVANNTALGTTAGGTTVASGGTLAINGGITSAEEIKLAGGTVTGLGNATLSGSVTADTGGGTILAATGTTLTVAALDTVNGGALAIGNGTNTGTVVANNSTGANGASTVAVNGGTLQIGGAGAGASLLDFTAGTSVASGATLNIGGFGTTVNALSGSGIVTNSGAAATLTLTGTSTFGGVIQNGAGATALAVTGGTARLENTDVTLTGINTFSGGTTVEGAGGFTAKLTLSGAGSQLSDAGLVTVNAAGTLEIDGNETIGALQGTAGGAVVLTSGVLTTGDASSTTFIGVISGAGGLTKAGTGTLNLAGASTFTGATTVNAGVVNVTGALASQSITVNSSASLRVDGAAISDAATVTLNDTGNLTLTGNERIGALASLNSTTTVTLGAFTLTTGDAGDDTFAGVISGAGGLTKVGTGSMTLTGASNYTGLTTVSAGMLTLGNNSTLGTTAVGTVVESGAALGLGGGTTTAEGITISGTGVAGNGAIRFLSGGNTMTGTITLSAAAEIQGEGFASLSINGTVTGANHNLTFDTVASSQITVSGAINTGTGTLTKTGTGTLDLAGASTFTGATTVNAGVVNVTGTLASQSITVNSSASLRVDGAAISDAATVTLSGTGNLTLTGAERIGALAGVAGTTVTLGAFTLTTGDAGNDTFAGIISGTGGLTKVGTGVFTLAGDNTYSGTTTISAGTLQIGAGGAGSFGSGAVVNNGALVFDGADTTTVSNAISGTGTLTVTAGDILALTGNNTYSGTTIINGTLQIGGNSTTGTLGTGLVTNNGQLYFLRSDAVTVANVISGSGEVGKGGSNTVTMSGANTYTGETNVFAGVLDITGSIASQVVNVNGGSLRVDGAAIANTATVTLGGTGNLTLTGSERIGALAGVAGTTVTLGAFTLTTGDAGNDTFAGIISGTGGLTKQGTGVFTLAGDNTYSGTTTISAGTLQVGAGGTTGSLGTGAVVNNGVLVFDRSDLFEVANAISGTGALTVTAGASVILTGANSYSGTTTINAGGGLTLGTFGVSSTTGTLGTGAVTNNGVLGFARTDAITVANAISGSGQVAQYGSGTTTLSGVNTYTGDTQISGGTLNVTGSLASQSIFLSGGSLRVDGAAISDTATVLLNHSQGGGDLTLTGSETIGRLQASSPFALVNLGGNHLTLAAQTFGLGTATFNGSAGVDRLTVTLGAAEADFTLAGVQFTNWTEGTDIVTVNGNALANRLTGNAGNNRLDGGAGVDTLVGGLGNDTYVNPLGDIITELAAGGTDTVESNATFSLAALAQVERLTLTGTGNFNASGNALANVLTGNSGNNILNGNAGADTMIGGLGNDIYYVDAAGDLTTELFNQGTDLVSSSVSHTLKVNIENLNLSGTANIDGNGNTGANRINGNSGNNILRGDAGADTLNGGDGNDILLGGTGSDSLNPGVDAVRDIIRFSAVGESTGSQRDIVTGMDLTAEDRFDFTVVPTSLVFVGGGALNLATINSDLSAAVDAALALNGAVLFDPGSGDMNVAGHLFVVVDANGDGVYRPNQDYVVQLINSTGFLTLDDFI